MPKAKSFKPMGMHELGEQNDLFKLKYVKKASQWCKTYFVKGKQVQEWFDSKEEAEKAEKKT